MIDHCVGGYLDKNAETYADIHGNACIEHFSHFEFLPTELRLNIWQEAFHGVDSVVAVCSFAGDQCDIMVSHPHSMYGQSPSVAQACREARKEWFRLSNVYEGDKGALEYLFIPRTLFFVFPTAVISSQLENPALPIEHVAIDIADSPDVFLLFEALSRLRSLRTIIIIIPSDAVEENQVVKWQKEIRQDWATLNRMSSLVDRPAPDGEWHQRTYMGWVLCNYLESSLARKYYADNNRPRIKLFVDQGGSSLPRRPSTDQPWALYFY